VRRQRSAHSRGTSRGTCPQWRLSGFQASYRPRIETLSESIVELIFYLKWSSGAAVHTDGFQAGKVCFECQVLTRFIENDPASKLAYANRGSAHLRLNNTKGIPMNMIPDNAYFKVKERKGNPYLCP
jgi:hypothetical protein